MISTGRKAKAVQRGKSSEEMAPAGKAIWHRPAVRRLETLPATQHGVSPDLDGFGGDESKEG